MASGVSGCILKRCTSLVNGKCIYPGESCKYNPIEETQDVRIVIANLDAKISTYHLALEEIALGCHPDYGYEYSISKLREIAKDALG